MASLNSLRLLAKHAPTIFGKAQTYETVITQKDPTNGRPDFVDESTEEMRQAIEAIDDLQKLHAMNERAAMILYAVYVVWGERTRLIKDPWVELWRAITPNPIGRDSATKRHNHWVACTAEHQKALELWRKI